MNRLWQSRRFWVALSAVFGIVGTELLHLRPDDVLRVQELIASIAAVMVAGGTVHHAVRAYRTAKIKGGDTKS